MTVTLEELARDLDRVAGGYESLAIRDRHNAQRGAGVAQDTLREAATALEASAVIYRQAAAAIRASALSSPMPSAQEAFAAGFAASGETWNGYYPVEGGDPDSVAAAYEDWMNEVAAKDPTP